MSDRSFVARCAAALGLMLATTAIASADSCWDHNGSLMRLKANGNERWFYYERPKASIVDSGVRKGTLLFDGVKTGNRYSGTARVFSKYCPDEPLQYPVSGPVSSDQLRVTLRGTREVYDQCQPTGKMTDDTLVFTYVRDC